MSHHEHNFPNCLNCGHTLEKDFKFCPNCGQHPTDGKIPFSHLFLEFFEGVFHLDGKLITTLRHVFIPGKLTLEFFKGKHKSYAAPFQLFLVLGGLYFVLLSKTMHKGEENFSSKLERTKLASHLKFILIKEDSICNTFGIYRNQPAVKLFADSLIKKTYFVLNPKGATSIAAYYSASLKRLEVARLRPSKKYNLFQKDSIIKKLMRDSVYLIKDIVEEKGISELEAEKISKVYADSVEKSKAFEKGVLFINFDGAGEINILQPDSVKASSSIINLKKKYIFSTEDIYNENENEILEQYKVQGFWDRVYIRQVVRLIKTGGNLIHFLMSKLIWIILASMFPLALFLQLLYERQHKYLVEHFLFLMHFLCYFFIVSIIYLGLPLLLESFTSESSTAESKYDLLSNLFSVARYLIIFGGLWFAMYQFYKEPKFKTSWKFAVFILVAFIVGLIILGIGSIISLALF